MYNDTIIQIFVVGMSVCTVVLAVVLVGGFLFGVFVWYPRHREKNIEKLKQAGRQGEATILDFEDLNAYNPKTILYHRVRVKLAVRVMGVEPYELEKNFTFPMQYVHLLRTGAVVPVWIDPQRPLDQDKVVIQVK